MPNGGDLTRCTLARPFFYVLKDTLESFGKRYGLNFYPWDHEMPRFVFHKLGVGDNIYKYIQIEILPFVGTEEAIVAIFVNVFSGDRKRFKGWFVARGVLVRDKERVDSWLEVAYSIFSAIKDEDVVISMELANRQDALKPLFDIAGFLGEKSYLGLQYI